VFKELNKLLDVIDKHLPATAIKDFDFEEFEKAWTGKSNEDLNDLR
jgi:hypothetical protein